MLSPEELSGNTGTGQDQRCRCVKNRTQNYIRANSRCLPSHIADCFLSIPFVPSNTLFFCCRWEIKLQTKQSEPCTRCLSMAVVECRPGCVDLNFHSAGTFQRGFCTLFQNFHRAAGQDSGMLLPFVSEAVFFACHALRTSPGGSSRRSLDYDHYLVNKMSTRCFLDTLLSKSRKVQKWTPPFQWAPNLLFHVPSRLKGLDRGCHVLVCLGAGTSSSQVGWVSWQACVYKTHLFGHNTWTNFFSRNSVNLCKAFSQSPLEGDSPLRGEKKGLPSSTVVHFRESWLALHSLLNRAKEGPRGVKGSK